VQWPFADFLRSEYARNWFFGAHYQPYTEHPESYSSRNLFAPIEKSLGRTLLNLGLSFVVAAVSTRIGLALGSWMVRVRR
jgi:hypothetical protein